MYMAVECCDTYIFLNNCGISRVGVTGRFYPGYLQIIRGNNAHPKNHYRIYIKLILIFLIIPNYVFGSY